MQFGNHEEFDFPIQKFERMLKTNDVLFFDANEFENIANFYLDVGNMSLAKKAIKLGLDQHPNSSGLLLIKADVLIFEDKFDEALSLLLYLSELEPNNDEVYILKANLYAKQNNHDQAVSSLQEALKCAEDPLEIYHLIGMEYLMAENYDQAKDYFIKSLGDNYDDFSTIFNIIFCFDFSDQSEGAIAFLEGLIDKNPYSAIAWNQLGLIHSQDGRLEKALECFDFAIISDEFFYAAYMEKAKILEKMGNPKEAINFFKLTLQMDDPTAYAYYRIGKCYLKLEDTEKAIKNFKKCIHEDPLMDRAWLALADTYIKLQDFEKAYKFVKRAINIDEENPYLWDKLSFICLKLDKVLESYRAEIMYQELNEENDLDEVLDDIDDLIAIDDFQAALDEVRSALILYPGSIELGYREAGLLFILKQFDLAVPKLKEVYEVEPEYFNFIKICFPELFENELIDEIIKNKLS
ncbi:MAG: tetratricopeptide repeat protein [Bacteroidota bacterium]